MTKSTHLFLPLASTAEIFFENITNKDLIFLRRREGGEDQGKALTRMILSAMTYVDQNFDFSYLLKVINLLLSFST